MEKLLSPETITHFLRQGISGAIFLFSFYYTRGAFESFLKGESGTRQLLNGITTAHMFLFSVLSLTIGSLIYTFHRACLNPLIERYRHFRLSKKEYPITVASFFPTISISSILTIITGALLLCCKMNVTTLHFFTLFSIFAILVNLLRGAPKCPLQEEIDDRSKSRWHSNSSKLYYASHIKTWGDYIHALYTTCFALLLGSFAASTLSKSPSLFPFNPEIAFIGIILFAAGLRSDLRKHKLEEDLYKDPTATLTIPQQAAPISQLSLTLTPAPVITVPEPDQLVH